MVAQFGRDFSGACTNLASIVFSAPSSSAAAERSFKLAGLNPTSERARLGEDKVEMLAVIRGLVKQLKGVKWNTWIENRLEVTRFSFWV